MAFKSFVLAHAKKQIEGLEESWLVFLKSKFFKKLEFAKFSRPLLFSLKGFAAFAGLVEVGSLEKQSALARCIAYPPLVL